MADYTDEDYWAKLVKMSLSRFFVLHALSQKPMYGYEITKWVAELTDGCCAPSEGSLYPLLKDLNKENYVKSETKKVSGRKRKIYTLTEKGELAYKKASKIWGNTARMILIALNDELNNEASCNY